MQDARAHHARLPYGGRRHTETVAGAAAVELRDVEVAYPGVPRPALQGISLRIAPGRRVALVGPNGSGKSTLLKAVAGVQAARAGVVLVHGSPLGCCRHRVAYLPQHGEIDWDFPINVERLVLTGRYTHLGWLARPGRRDRELTAAAMARIGIADLARRQIGRLSGGQRQRVLLARALAQQADVLLLDEPASAMDADARAALEAIIADLARDGVTVLMATHDLGRHDAAVDEAIYLHEGREIPSPRAIAGDERGVPWTG